MRNSLNQHLSYPDEIQAQEFYDKYKGKDPFASTIDPALLNSGNIADYVATTGMITPFDPTRLGPASYEMVLGGEYLYWDEEGKQYSSKALCENEEVVLRKNSITYVSVRETFRIPDYIALRFNLRVKHVHRGLLLGTGPLIDPGFHGNIMIPIHNFTSNEYIISSGEELISVEFTKVSPSTNWEIDPAEELTPKGQYVTNSGKNSKKPFETLLKKVLPIGIGRVVSSLSGTLAKANKQIDQLSKYQKYSIGAGVAVFVALLSMFYTTQGVISDANKYVADASMLIKKYEQDDVDIRNFVVRDEVNLMKKNVDKLEKQLAKLKEQNMKLYGELMLRPRGNIDVSCPIVCDEKNNKVKSNANSKN